MCRCFLQTLKLTVLLLMTSLLSTIAYAAEKPQWVPCPQGVGEKVRCYNGQDSQGAFYWIALPERWNQVLVIHAHGGPDTSPPTLLRPQDDLKRWAVLVKEGYAWAGSSYRRGGYGVTMAAEDTERLRQIFVANFGAPQRTLLHGQSYGGAVASKAVELFATSENGKSPYDAVLLTSGVLGGGVNAYNFRLDLRVVYQYYCHNLPRKEEPAYPLWMGLPADMKLNKEELVARVDECTGWSQPREKRTTEQQRKLDNIVHVLKIPEEALVGHLMWSTLLFRDVVQQRLQGKNPFGNVGVVYHGSDDDVMLNKQVLRYQSDPQAIADLEKDSLPSGNIPVPVLTLHSINDPTAFVELETKYRQLVTAAGHGNRLVQVFADEKEHSYLGDPYYPELFAAMRDWLDKGVKPTPQRVADSCQQHAPAVGGKCRIVTSYQPASLESRVPPRS